MPHPLVEQLRFTRSEWSRALRGTSEGDGQKRLQPMNSIGWIVGHLAWQEQRYWLTRAQGKTPVPILNELVANGAPASTPPLTEMLEAWRAGSDGSAPPIPLDPIDRWNEVGRILADAFFAQASR